MVEFLSIIYCMWQGLLSYHVRVTPTEVELSPFPNFSSDTKLMMVHSHACTPRGCKKVYYSYNEPFGEAGGSQAGLTENDLKNRESRPAWGFYGGLGLGLELCILHSLKFLPKPNAEASKQASFSVFSDVRQKVKRDRWNFKAVSS